MVGSHQINTRTRLNETRQSGIVGLVVGQVGILCPFLEEGWVNQGNRAPKEAEKIGR
ncbi:MAG: hypothetical protein QME16_06135 [Planctomycetota bacterium]|nr:hypothetical protein [Planctomycetota bacterium]